MCQIEKFHGKFLVGAKEWKVENPFGGLEKNVLMKVSWEFQIQGPSHF